MPRYEYRCRACGETFEKTRPMAESSAPIACPSGHEDTVKLFSMVAVSTGAVSSSAKAAPQAGGACCGGGCCS